MKQAIIDIGSHSIHLVIYRQKGKDFEKMMSKTMMAGLINYIYEGELNQQGLDIFIETLQDIQKTIKCFHVDSAYFFATAALRTITNRQEILRYIKTSLGIHIEVLSNLEEGRLGFYGMKKSIQMTSGVMIDIGGGSCEIVHFLENKMVQNQSFPLGSLGLYKDYVKGITPTTRELNQMYDEIKSQIQTIDKSHQLYHAVGIGGTMRTMIRVARTLLKKNHIQDTITKEEIDYLIRQLIQNKKKYAHTILQIKPERIHTFIPGLMILKEIINQLEIKDITISYTGLRDGYFLKRVLKNTDD